MSIRQRVLRWYEGTYIPEPPGSPFLMGFYERHWSSRFAHAVVEFYIKEWKWIIGITLTCVSLLFAFLKLP